MIRAALASLFFLMAQWGITQSSLQSSIAKIFEAEAFEYASAGVSVRGIDGKEICAVHGNKKYIPASSLKLITTLSALEIFGEDYQFKTKIGYSGILSRDGSLQGNIVIIGSGDPTLGSTRFGNENSFGNFIQKVLSAIQSKGIKCIDGGIEIRTNVFTGQAIPANWPYSDISNYYASGAWAVNINENLYKLSFHPGKTGSIAQVKNIDPQIPYLNVDSEVEILGAKTSDNAYIYGDEFNYNKVVRGSIPYTSEPFVIKGAIPNPPLTLAMILESHLQSAGITIGKSTVVNAPIKKADFNELMVHTSHHLSEIVQQANYESINIYCESLLRLIGKKESGVGSIEKGLESLEKILDGKGIDEHSFHIEDGSGLSPRNTITPDAFTQFLSEVAKKKELDEILEYIPQTGVSGTVSSLLRGKSAQKKFYLKSGSMGGVLSYTGYFQGKSKKWYAVSFISNNHSHGNSKIRKEAEKIFELLYQKL